MSPNSRGTPASPASPAPAPSSSTQPPAGVVVNNNEGSGSFKGFLAGTASGVTKLLIGHPFDCLKVRMQVSPYGTYKGPWDCLVQLARRESLLGLYKGASPPAVGWAISDSILLGTLHNLRLCFSRFTGTGGESGRPLPVGYHALAGLGAGWTNSLVTTPTENLKTLLQMQFQRVSMRIPGSAAAAAEARQFTGPIDAAKQIIRHHGPLGLWRTLPATLTFRSSFAAMFGSFELCNRGFANLKGTPYEISPGLATFLSGGIAAEIFWITAFPADAIKNLMMSDYPQAAAPGSKPQLKYPTMRSAFLHIWNRAGPEASFFRRVRVFYTGFLPCLLRAFPTNAAALFVYEGCMELMSAERVVTK